METNDLMEIHRALGRIEGKQDAIMAAQVSLKEDQQTLKKEVDQVKFKLNWYSGALAVLGFIGVFFKNQIVEVIFA